MISYLASIFLLATVSAVPSGRVEVVFPSVETSRSGVKTVKFTALDQDVELKLRSAGEILGKRFSIQDVDVESLRRKIYRDSVNGAALLIDEDGPLTIEGIVNSKLRIQPFESGRIIKDGIIAHQIVEVIDDKKSYDRVAVIPENVKRNAENVSRMARDDDCIVVEYYIVTDSAFTKRFKSNSALTNYVTVMFTGVQNLMDTLELGIGVRLLGVTTFTEKTEPSFIKDNLIPGPPAAFNPDVLISAMSKYYCNHQTGLAKDTDLIFLITARGMGDPREDGTVDINTAGIANSASVCKPCFKCGVATDDSDYNERVDTLAHESVHLLGSPHDGEGPNQVSLEGSPGAANCPAKAGYIMGNRNDKNKYKFSPCTKKCVEYLLSKSTASCIFQQCSDF
uniref:Metalloprotease n=1 Tax=Tityus melici TaxID=3026321 RepID=A0AA49KAA8_9SCOR|nr:putative metalloprotease [Tityus melici]